MDGFPRLTRHDLTFDPLLDAGFDGDEILQTSCAARNVRATPVRQAGVQVTVPGDTNQLAGALGAEFLPDQSGQLLIMVLASDLHGDGAPGALLPGIPTAYANDVLRAARATDEIEALGAGVLSFDRGLFVPEQASAELFEWMASAVVRLLVPELRELPEDEFYTLLGAGQMDDELAEAYSGEPDVIWLDDVAAPDEVPVDVYPAEEIPSIVREPAVPQKAAFVFDDILEPSAGEETVELPPEDVLALGRVGERTDEPEGVDEAGDEPGEGDPQVDSVLAALLQAFYEERRGEPREPISLDFVLPAEEAVRVEAADEVTLSDLLSSLYEDASPQQQEEIREALDVEAEWWVEPEAELSMNASPGNGDISAVHSEFLPIFDDEL